MKTLPKVFVNPFVCISSSEDRGALGGKLVGISGFKPAASLGRWMLVVGCSMLFFLPTTAQACAVCFGAPDDPVVQAIGQSILFLLVCIMLVIGTIMAFFIHLMIKSNRHALREEAAQTNGQPRIHPEPTHA